MLAMVEELKPQLKRLFVGYRTMTSKLRRKLESIGFSVTDGGRHYKLLFSYQNKPIIITISKSASDYRCGLNIVSSICQQLNKNILACNYAK